MISLKDKHKILMWVTAKRFRTYIGDCYLVEGAEFREFLTNIAVDVDMPKETDEDISQRMIEEYCKEFHVLVDHDPIVLEDVIEWLKGQVCPECGGRTSRTNTHDKQGNLRSAFVCLDCGKVEVE